MSFALPPFVATIEKPSLERKRIVRPSGDQLGRTPNFVVTSRVGPPSDEMTWICVPQLPFLAKAICLPSGDQVGEPCCPVGQLIACVTRWGARLARAQPVAPAARSTTIPAAIRISRRDIGGREGSFEAGLDCVVAKGSLHSSPALRALPRPR